MSRTSPAMQEKRKNRRFCMWLCFGVVWPQRDGRSCVLLDTATTDTLVLDQSFFRPLGMQHFYDSFALESQICVRRDALVEWLTERCTFHADAKSSLAAQSKQHDRFVPCQQLGLCILRLHCLQFSIFFTMRRISCVCGSLAVANLTSSRFALRT